MSGKTLTFLFRYGAGEHVDFLPALPELCRRLTEAGWTVEHQGFRGRMSAPPELTAHCRIRELPFRVNRASAWDKTVKAALWILLLPLLGWRLRRRGVDVVFVDETLPLSAAALRLTYSGKLCFTIHDFFSDIYLIPRKGWGGVGRLCKRIDERSWRRLDHVFTRAAAAREYLVDRGVERERISVVPDSVDTERFRPGPSMFRARRGLRDGDRVLVHHGILHPNKGNLRLVEAAARLRDAIPDLKWVLIGDGPEMPRLRKRIHDHALEAQVVLTGWLEDLDAIADALRAADIGVVMRTGMPGDDFHVTSTLVHNLASGLPVLAARLSGIEDVLTEGREGFLFDPECGEEFDHRLKHMLQNPESSARMKRRARQTAERCFSRDRIAGSYFEVLSALDPVSSRSESGQPSFE